MRCLYAVVIVVLLALLGGGKVEAWAAFWKKYGTGKIMQSCLTPSGEENWVALMDRALAYCNEQEASGALPVDTLAVAAFPENVDKNQTTVSAARFTAAKIENLKQKLKKRVQVFRCVMQKVQVTDSTFEVNTEIVLARYRALNITDILYGDIEQAVIQCHQFTQCMPVETHSSLAIPADVIRTKAFLECEKNLRYLGCIKQDLKRWVGTFDFSGLDGTLDFLPSDEARAAAILLANDKVGYRDYGLFE